MTQDECKQETFKHINQVCLYTAAIASAIMRRGVNHDASKLESPELEIFTEYTPKLSASTYGSDEYKQYLKEMNVALKHHYENNRHHPEYFKNGINDMNLLDILEMICDWIAATKRHDNGNILDSIELNQKRFKYNDTLKQIFVNTVTALFEITDEVVPELTKKPIDKMKVFLGGTWNDSTWRDDLIPNLKIDYFNPIVKDWNDECYQEELRQRELCDYCLYIITPKMTGLYSIAEVVDDSNKRPKKTIFHFMKEDGDSVFDEGQIKSLARIGLMIRNNGGYYFDSL